MTSGGRDDWGFIVILALALSVIAVFNSLNVAHEWARNARPIPAWEPFVWETSSVIVLLGLAPLVLAFTRRVWPWPLRPKPILQHLAAAALVSLVHVAAMGAIRWAVYAAVGERYDPVGPLSEWPYELRKDLLVYAGLVGVYATWRQLRAPPPASAPAEPALEVRDGARRRFVPLAEVAWIEAAGNYVELHRGGGPVLHRASLAEMERQLAGSGFVRIHRSRLVQRGAVDQVESKPSGDYVVRLRDGRELAGSRRYRRPLLEP